MKMKQRRLNAGLKAREQRRAGGERGRIGRLERGEYLPRNQRRLN